MDIKRRTAQPARQPFGKTVIIFSIPLISLQRLRQEGSMLILKQAKHFYHPIYEPEMQQNTVVLDTDSFTDDFMFM